MSESKGKSLFIEFTESTTLHGIRNVFCGDSKLRRLIWFLCVLGSTASFVWFCTGLVRSYLKGEVVTRVTVVNQDNVMFPAVTVCNFNPIRKSYIPLLNMSDSEIFAGYMLKETANYSNEDFQKFATSYTDEFFRIASHQIEHMLWNCTLQGEKCLPEDFQMVITNMGVCYTSDFDKRLASSREIVSPGENYGLTMTLNAELNEYYSTLAPAIGFRISIHEKNELPLFDVNGFATMPGVSTFVAIKKNKVISLPCENKKLLGTLLYTKQLCYENCKRRYINEKCDCIYLETSGGNESVNAFPCTFEQLFGCVFVEEENFAKLSNNCSCPQPCEQVSYDTSLSYGMFSVDSGSPYRAAMEANQKVSDYDFIAKNNFVRVKIFFQDLNFHIVEDIPKYDLPYLLASAGGMLGLLLGASVLTLVEFLDFLITLLGIKNHQVTPPQ